jgi:hypothetical protein
MSRIFSVFVFMWIGGGAAFCADAPVRVFILAGQSNMEGHGAVPAEAKRNEGRGSLERLAKDADTAPRFAHLLASDGSWKLRDDVWIAYGERRGWLTAGYGANPRTIGPELGFGWVVGDATSEPVLLIKCAWGGKSLAVDFRPPSAGGETGPYYKQILTDVAAVLADLSTHAPSFAGRPTVLAGFGWHQGWNDRINDKYNAEYELNLAHFIRDMRRDLKSPGLPFVVAETGMNGPDETHPRALSLMKAQAAVAAYPEFQGNVAFVKTQNFWRPKEQSPSGQGYHWNTNAETYYLIGEGMGRAMLGMTGTR